MNLTQAAWWLAVLGAINVGLTVLNFNVVDTLVGSWPQLAQILYLLIGVSGLYLLLTNLSSTGKKKR